MSHLYATKRPMSSARRSFIHGPLHPLDRPATAWDLLKRGSLGGLGLIGFGLVALFSIIAIGG